MARVIMKFNALKGSRAFIAASGIGKAMFFYLILLVPSPLTFAYRNPEILILSSYHKGDDWSDKEIEGFTQGLKKVHPYAVPSVEYLDTKRFPSTEHLGMMRQYLAYKYANKRFDLLVILDNPALDMVLGWEKGPFDGIPKVFAGINDFRDETIKGRKDITGVSEAQDLEGTIRLALTLQPDAREALLICDPTSSGIALKKHAERMKPVLDGMIRISFAGEGDFSGLEDKLKGLQKDAFVIIMTYVTDASNRTFTRKESTTLICNASPVPVYAMHETRLGHGIMGGMIIEGREHGRQAAGIGLRILAGESPGDIPVEKSISRAMLDYRLLSRFGISQRDWPRDALIVDKPAAVSERLGHLLIPVSLAGGALLILTLLMGVLVRRTRRAERRARQREVELRSVLEAYPESSLLLSQEGTILTLNKMAAERLGIDPKGAVGRTVFDLIPAPLAEARRRRLEEVVSTGKGLDFEDERQGRIYRNILTPLFDQENAVRRVAIFAQDITDYRRKEAELRLQNEILSAVKEAQERFISGGSSGEAFRGILMAMVKVTGSKCGCIGSLSADGDGSFQTSNLATCKDGSLEHDPFCGECSPQALCQMLLKKGAEAIRNGEATMERLGCDRPPRDSYKEGEPLCNCLGIPLSFGGKLVGFVAVAGNPQGYGSKTVDGIQILINTSAGLIQAIRVEEREKEQTALIKEREELFRAVFDSTGDAVIVIDKERRIQSCNKAFMDLFGYEQGEIIGKSTLVLYQREDDFTTFGDVAYPIIKAHGSYRGELRVKKKDGSPLTVESVTSLIRHSGLLSGYVAVMRDITDKRMQEEERERLKDELMQVQKLEAVGTLAGGIAHDFNNILGIIMGSSGLALMEAREGSSQAQNIELTIKAAKRAKDLVGQILAFSRKAKQDLRPLRLDLVVSEALKFLRSTLPATIEITKNIEKDSGEVYADLTQMHQVVMNLCVNAGHAMKEKGGVLSVSLDRLEVMEADAVSLRLPGPGSYCRLRVSDTGHGIRPDIINRIFEPYFTTKNKEEGTGLGLAVVKGIVDSHGGSIRVESNFGHGATFEVFLPIAKGPGENLIETAEEITCGRGERILVVDDEPDLLRILESMLKGLGYEVESQINGVSALEAFERSPDRYHLVITDMTMPGMTGLQLAVKLKKIRQDLPVVICTGFSEAISEETASKYGLSGILFKPVSQRDLAAVADRAFAPMRAKGEKTAWI